MAKVLYLARRISRPGSVSASSGDTQQRLGRRDPLARTVRHDTPVSGDTAGDIAGRAGLCGGEPRSAQSTRQGRFPRHDERVSETQGQPGSQVAEGGARAGNTQGRRRGLPPHGYRPPLRGREPQIQEPDFHDRHDQVAGLGNPEGSQRALNMLFALRTIQQRTGRDLGRRSSRERPSPTRSRNCTCFSSTCARRNWSVRISAPSMPGRPFLPRKPSTTSFP